MHLKNTISMRLKELYQRHKLQIAEALLLMGLLTALWRIDNWFVSFICGVSAGLLFYRLADRISQHGIRKA
jgi:F0F1-type ATP synthase assembly protein I